MSLTIGQRIVAGFAACVLVTAGVGAFAYLQVDTVDRDLKVITGDAMPGIVAVGKVEAQLQGAVKLVLMDVLAPDADARAKLEERIGANAADLDASFKEYEAQVEGDEDRRNFRRLVDLRREWTATRAAVVDLARAGRAKEAADLFGRDGAPAQDRLKAHAETMVKWNRDYADRAGGQATAAIASARAGTLAGVGIGVLVATALAYLIARGVNRALTRMSATLGEASGQVASAATQVSSASQSLAQGASEQASSLEETSSALEEITSMTKKNADTARQASALSAQAKAAGDKGNEAMARMGVAIGEIERSATETAKILKVIDGIAFQTNLLALNAAVEAARAGEAGKGFAVVAEEVRALAMRSAEAAKATGEMIERSVASARGGVEISAVVAATLAEMTSSSGRVNALLGEIAAASNEQTQGVSQINNSVGQMDKVTQGTAAGAEQAAAASEELSAQAAEMSATVDELVTLVRGAVARGTAHRTLAARTAAAPRAGGRLSVELAARSARRKASARPAAKPEGPIPFGDGPAAGGMSAADDAFADFNG